MVLLKIHNKPFLEWHKYYNSLVQKHSLKKTRHCDFNLLNEAISVSMLLDVKAEIPSKAKLFSE
jgi:hypothetical protein